MTTIIRTLTLAVAALGSLVQAVDMNSIEIKLERYRSRDCMGTGPVDLISERTFMLEHDCQSWKDEVPFEAIRYYWDRSDYLRNKPKNLESFGNCSIYIWENTGCFGDLRQILYHVNTEEKLNTCVPTSHDGRSGKSAKIVCYEGKAPPPPETTTVEVFPVATRF